MIIEQVGKQFSLNILFVFIKRHVITYNESDNSLNYDEFRGGCRLDQQQSVLSFTVNESLHMERGQEIEEMLSISIEPDIAIETFEEYMQIRGLIILQGECSKANNTEDKYDDEATEQNDATVYMEKVIDTQVNQMMFSHRFPVEVSVARNRIDNIAEVKVEVISFDYELPANDRINIEATLHIHGIKGDNVEQEKEEKQEEAEAVIEETAPTSEEHNVVNDQAQATEEEKELPATEEQAIQTDVSESLQDDAKIISESIEATDDQVIDIQYSETTAEVADEEVSDVLFLTDLFGEVEEASVTTMKIHIIQEEDTIESIAKRYDISALQLMKDNNIHADDMEPGALIYIENK